MNSPQKNKGLAKNGYKQDCHPTSFKRFCQTLDLLNQPEIIKKYIDAHSEANHWQEIRRGLRDVGILEMEIYIHGNKLFMIVETPIDFNWDIAFERLNCLPEQQEWEYLMSKFQQVDESNPTEKWQLMDRIFHLYDS